MIHVMLPVQYLRAAGRRRTDPQRRLMAAVVQTALDDLRGSTYRAAAGFGPATDPRAYEQARAYVASKDRSWPFSFENVCDAIGLDADRVRAALHIPWAGSSAVPDDETKGSTMSYASFGPCPHCGTPLSFLEAVPGSSTSPKCPRCHEVVAVQRSTFLMVDNSRPAARQKPSSAA